MRPRLPLGAAAIVGRHPHERPKRSKRSPAPLFHALSAGARREFWEAYRLFVAAFRQAAEKLRAGDRNAAFPLAEVSRGLNSRQAPNVRLVLFLFGWHFSWRLPETQSTHLPMRQST
jgi:hypothetical protein